VSLNLAHPVRVQNYRIGLLTCVIGPGTVAARNAIAAANAPNTTTVVKPQVSNNTCT